MSTLSSHVLDAALGRPAAGLEITLYDGSGPLASATTDGDGRVRFADPVGAGPHRLVLGTGAWFASAGRETFYPEVVLAFAIDPARPHHHVALLLSPYSYTTYLGS